MPTENEKNVITSALYYEEKLKWYEEIWYFITGKKKKWIKVDCEEK